MPFVEINVKNEIEKQRHNNPKHKKKTPYKTNQTISNIRCFSLLNF